MRHKVLFKDMGPPNVRMCYKKTQSTWLGEPLGKERDGANLFRPPPAVARFSLPPHLLGGPGQLNWLPVYLLSFSLAESRDLNLKPGSVTY